MIGAKNPFHRKFNCLKKLNLKNDLHFSKKKKFAIKLILNFQKSSIFFFTLLFHNIVKISIDIGTSVFKIKLISVSKDRLFLVFEIEEFLNVKRN